MKRNLLYIIILLVPFFLTNISFAKASPLPETIPILVNQHPLMTAGQIRDLIEVQTETIGQDKVVTLELVYADYGQDLVIVITSSNSFLETKENSIFDANAHAFFIKAISVYLLSQAHISGTPMAGLAYMNDKSVVVLIIVEDKVYLYDVEEKSFRRPNEYMKAGLKFALVII